jgi:hypothetical protein
MVKSCCLCGRHDGDEGNGFPVQLHTVGTFQDRLPELFRINNTALPTGDVGDLRVCCIHFVSHSTVPGHRFKANNVPPFQTEGMGRSFSSPSTRPAPKRRAPDAATLSPVSPAQGDDGGTTLGQLEAELAALTLRAADLEQKIVMMGGRRKLYLRLHLDSDEKMAMWARLGSVEVYREVKLGLVQAVGPFAQQALTKAEQAVDMLLFAVGQGATQEELASLHPAGPVRSSISNWLVRVLDAAQQWADKYITLPEGEVSRCARAPPRSVGHMRILLPPSSVLPPRRSCATCGGRTRRCPASSSLPHSRLTRLSLTA